MLYVQNFLLSMTQASYYQTSLDLIKELTSLCRYYVRPTQLRLKKEYIIYYHTWTWVVFTGNKSPLTSFILLLFGTTCSKMCSFFLRLNRSCEPKWLFVILSERNQISNRIETCHTCQATWTRWYFIALSELEKREIREL